MWLCVALALVVCFIGKPSRARHHLTCYQKAGLHCTPTRQHVLPLYRLKPEDTEDTCVCHWHWQAFQGEADI